MFVRKNSSTGPTVALLRLSGEVDIYRRPALDKALEELEYAQTAVVDLSEVTYFDLTLLNGLVHLKNQMSERHATSVVRLVGATRTVRRVLQITNLAPSFELSSDA